MAGGLQQPENRVDAWLRKIIKEGEVFYLYAVPEALNEWRRATGETFKAFGLEAKRIEGLSSKQASARWTSVINNFSPQKKHRYYCLEDNIQVIESEFSFLVKGNGSHRLEVSFGPSWNERTKYWVRDKPKRASEEMLGKLAGGERFYANVSFKSYRPTYSFQMIYQGSAMKEIMNTILRNADAVATELDRRLGL